MKKLNLLLVGVLVTVALLTVTSASAETACFGGKCKNNTIISGKIYNSDYTDVYADANVSVFCGGVEKDTVSLGDGAYIVNFNPAVCGNGSNVSVYATWNGLYGNNTGVVHGFKLEGLKCVLNFGVVNVPLIPEYGLVAGLATVMGAIAVFFYVRRK
jgi:hypothetical protein